VSWVKTILGGVIAAGYTPAFQIVCIRHLLLVLLHERFTIQSSLNSWTPLAWLSGDEARKWKFKEGSDGASWNANISDQEFLKKIIKGDIALSGADTLKVRVKQTQYKTGTGIKSEYEILQVIEHVKGFSQVPLDFSSPSSTPDKP